MANIASLLDYYYESMYPELQVLELDRLRIIKKLQKAALFLALIAVGVFLFLIRQTIMAPLQAALVCAMCGFLIYMFVYRHESSGYALLFKDQVIEKIIHFVDDSLTYRKSDTIREAEYQTSELFLESYDRFSGSDLVSGKIEGVDVRFCVMHVERKERDKNNKEQWHDIFSGLFFVAEFNKEFHSNVVVLPDIAERTLGVLGTWLQGMNISRGEHIKLDHVAFEKYFVVYGNDPIESRYILSPSLMEKIVEFRHKINKNISLSFINSKIYIAIPYTKPLFEPILSRSLLDFSYIKEYFEILNTMIGIVEELKLNEKLWSKR